MRELTQLFSALTDEERLRILALLIDREELCLCDLVKTLDQPRARLEKQLAVLADAGLVTTWRDGEWTLCKVRDAEEMGADARFAVSMLRCMLPGERSAELEARLQIWLIEKKRAGVRCVTSDCCAQSERRAAARAPKARARRRAAS